MKASAWFAVLLLVLTATAALALSNVVTVVSFTPDPGSAQPDSYSVQVRAAAPGSPYSEVGRIAAVGGSFTHPTQAGASQCYQAVPMLGTVASRASNETCVTTVGPFGGTTVVTVTTIP